MRQAFIKDNIVRTFDVIDNKVIVTIQINGVWVSNPSLDSFYADGWADYIQPTPEPYVPTKEERYKWRVIELIRERYDGDDEYALLRQRDAKIEEFAAYNTYCEECKDQAYREIYGENTDSSEEESV